MIEVVHRELTLLQEQLTQDALKHASLGVDAFHQFLLVKGRYEGLQTAIELVNRLMGERVDRDR